MKLKVDRAWKQPDYTIGRFFVNGVRFGETLEDTDRGLNSAWSEAAIKGMKIAGGTAIPIGTYKIALSVSPRFKNKTWAKKFGGLVPEIQGIKGFLGVRIHPGSNAEQTEGCILIGENKVKGGLINSQKKYLELMEKYLVPAWNAKEEIIITIK